MKQRAVEMGEDLAIFLHRTNKYAVVACYGLRKHKRMRANSEGYAEPHELMTVVKYGE